MNRDQAEAGMYRITRSLSGTGVGELPLVKKAYRTLQTKTPDEKTVIEYDGGSVTIIPSRSPAERSLYWRGRYEDHIRREIHRRLSPGETAIDVGAHVGHHTVSMREAVGPTGRVIAAEPSPRRREILRETLKCYDNVDITSVALSDNNSTDARLDETSIPCLSKHRTDGSGRPVTTATLDLLIDLFGLGSVQLVKIDVEGHEQRVIDGLQAHRDRVDSLLVEFHCSDGTEHRLFNTGGSGE